MRRVLDQVVARPGSYETVVVYFDPVHADVFAENPSLAVHARGADWVVYRRTAAGAPV